MTKTQFGAAMNTSRQWVHKMLRNGVIEAMPNGKIDYDTQYPKYLAHFPDKAAELAELNAVEDVDEEAPTTNVSRYLPDGSPTKAEADRLKSVYAADKMRLQVEELKGNLVEIEIVNQRAFDAAKLVQDRLLQLPSHMAPSLVGKDMKQIQIRLEKEVRDILSELSRAIESINND